MNNKRKPGKRLDINMYTEWHKLKRVKKLPTDLNSAIKLFQNNDIAKKAFTAKVVSNFVKLKKRELSTYSKQAEAHSYDWQRNNSIDC
jgi:glutamine synthetase